MQYEKARMFDILGGMGTKPKNPGCSICTDGCSESLKGDLCLWHSHRMGSLTEVKCGCEETTWKCVEGDSTARRMRRDYEIRKAEERGESFRYFVDFAVIDSAGKLHCCGKSQNADLDIGSCGDMRVCGDCYHKHKIIVLKNVTTSDMLNADQHALAFEVLEEDKDPWGEWRGGCYMPETLKENLARGELIKERLSKK